MSEKINWTPELLAECRNEKGVVLGMMSEDAKKALRANREHAERFMSDGWLGRPVDESWHVDSGHFAYRLSPSYTPPELAPKPYVDCLVFSNGRELFMYKSPYSEWSYTIECAQANKKFIGYVYADKMVSCHPRRDDFDCGIALAPVAVRFWTGTGGAK